MATISFDLVSPENLVFNDEVGTIIVPGKDGDLGILPGHSKVMSSLRPGRTPKSPSFPGTIIIPTCSLKIRFSGETKSKEIVATMLLLLQVF